MLILMLIYVSELCPCAVPEIFGKRLIPRMLNKHPDAITAKLKEAEQDHPKNASISEHTIC